MPTTVGGVHFDLAVTSAVVVHPSTSLSGAGAAPMWSPVPAGATMAAVASQTTADAATPADTPRRGPAARIGRAAAVIVVLGSVLLWLYAFSGAARRDPPNQLDDPGFGEAAEPICAEAMAAVDALPLAHETPTVEERAAVIEEANAALTAMVDELDTIVVTSSRDQQMTDEWLTDWRDFIEDRAQFAAAIRTDESARFYVTEKPGGLQVTKAIDDLATVNDMPSCASPGDVG